MPGEGGCHKRHITYQQLSPDVMRFCIDMYMWKKDMDSDEKPSRGLEDMPRKTTLHFFPKPSQLEYRKVDLFQDLVYWRENLMACNKTTKELIVIVKRMFGIYVTFYFQSVLIKAVPDICWFWFQGQNNNFSEV